jgi:diadenosine tetraphosphatase ApaH/serine/threonine PP2A family protein phosphatase
VRIGVISDIHANLAALEAVLGDMGPVDALWCLGDVVGYGPEPNECVARLRDLSAVCIAGNHDWAAIGRVDVRDFNADAAAAAVWTAQQLTPENRDWLANCPETVEQDEATLAHGSPCDPIWEYVMNAPVASRCLSCFDTTLCLVGHSHIPSGFYTGPGGTMAADYAPAGWELELQQRRILANPGSVGQPRDHDSRAAYLVYDTATGRLSWRRAAYPVAVTQEKMLRAGLPRRLALRLENGR